MLTAFAFLRQHWLKFAALIAIVVAFIVGRASAPTPETKTEVQERVVYRNRVVEHQVAARAEQRTRVVYRDRVISPDGTRHDREVERTESAAQSAAVTARVETRDVVRTVERRVEVQAPRPQWRVSALAGVDLRDTHPLALQPGTISAGVLVDHRLVGGLSVGAWGLHRFDRGPSWPLVGVSVSLEF